MPTTMPSVHVLVVAVDVHLAVRVAVDHERRPAVILAVGALDGVVDVALERDDVRSCAWS
jgi:hypothetical protein